MCANAQVNYLEEDELARDYNGGGKRWGQRRNRVVVVMMMTKWQSRDFSGEDVNNGVAMTMT